MIVAQPSLGMLSIGITLRAHCEWLFVVASMLRGVLSMRVIFAVVAVACVAFSRQASADIYPAFPPPYYGSYNWSGVYFGGQFGGAWDRINNKWPETDRYFLAGTRIDTKDAAIGGGGQIGYQQQWGNWLLGVEVGALRFSDLTDRVVTDLNPTFNTPGNGVPNGVENDVKWAVTFTPRLGYVWDRWLVYAKGGYALMDFHTTTVQCCTPLNTPGNPFVNPSVTTRSDEWHGGWVAGGGFEFALTNYASFGVDYQQIFIDDETHSGPAVPAPGLIVNAPLIGKTNVDGDINIVTARLNFRFGGDPEPVPVPLK
jgi:outer membrane immunogenic protein